jgi:hypothetical protein
MRATEFLIERWNKKTVMNYFDHKQDLEFKNSDVQVSKPFDGCVLLRYQSVPDVARSFFRVAEYYDGKHYGGRSRQVSLTDFLDNWMDRAGRVDYFKFWDGFNIPDHGFKAWKKSAGALSDAEQVMVDAVNKAAKGLGKYCVIGVGGNDSATLRHEMFHARYYLDSAFKSQADALIQAHKNDPAFKAITQTLIKKLDYVNHVDEEVAAYLYTGSQMKLVFGTEAKELVALFKELDKNEI